MTHDTDRANGNGHDGVRLAVCDEGSVNHESATDSVSGFESDCVSARESVDGANGDVTAIVSATESREGIWNARCDHESATCCDCEGPRRRDRRLGRGCRCETGCVVVGATRSLRHRCAGHRPDGDGCLCLARLP